MPEQEVTFRGRAERRASRGIAVPVAVLVIAIVAFLGVVLVGLEIVAPGRSQTADDWATIGGVVLLVLLLALLVYAYLSRGRALDRAAWSGEAPPALVSALPRRHDEVRRTGEQWRGMEVLEYSKPPKSQERNALYTRCYVPLDAQRVLRVEDLIAKRRGSA